MRVVEVGPEESSISLVQSLKGFFHVETGLLDIQGNLREFEHSSSWSHLCLHKYFHPISWCPIFTHQCPQLIVKD